MPLYNYHCEQCGREFEVRKAIKEIDTPTACPDCGKTTTRRLINVVAVFSSEQGGQVRQIAGASGCSGCAMSATGCSGSCGCRR